MEHNNINIKELISQIEEITEFFYQQKNNSGYQKLIPVIDSLTKVVDEISELEQESSLVEKKDRFKGILNDAMEAMVNNDTILLADILKYDISEILTEVLNSDKE